MKKTLEKKKIKKIFEDWFVTAPDQLYNINTTLEGMTVKANKSKETKLDIIIRELAIIKKDVSELKEDVAELKNDVSELKEDVADIKKRVARIEACPTIQRELKDA